MNLIQGSIFKAECCNFLVNPETPNLPDLLNSTSFKLGHYFSFLSWLG